MPEQVAISELTQLQLKRTLAPDYGDVVEISSDIAEAWIVPLAGPSLGALKLCPRKGKLIIGRHEQCDLRLSAEAVSRFHAELSIDRGKWQITDLKSRWGTFVNGQRIGVDVKMPLCPGDLVGIIPWTFSFSLDPTATLGVDSTDDIERNQTMVREISPQRSGALAEDRLALLLEVTAAMQNVVDERSLSDVLVDAASRATEFANIAVLRRVDADGRVEVIAARNRSAGQILYSRSLINAASSGRMAAFVPQEAQGISNSILTMKIEAALCVPLVISEVVAGFLYLDARGGKQSTPPRQWAAASAFCAALGRIASLALANLKRLDVERRAAMAESELQAAAEAQRWVMPRREISLPPFRCCGESRPGRYVGGDFFDLISLGEGKLAVALGDVAGKGFGASIFMTVAQGFLNAALQQHGRPELAVAQLSRFLLDRQPGGQFLTLWVGLLDATDRTLHYVDAGHGYAFIQQPTAKLARLDAGDNVPIGAADEPTYSAVRVQLPEHGRLLVVSDGIVEQRGISDDSSCARFGMENLRTCIVPASDPRTALSACFDAVIQHAGTPSLSDDATAVVVDW